MMNSEISAGKAIHFISYDLWQEFQNIVQKVTTE